MPLRHGVRISASSVLRSPPCSARACQQTGGRLLPRVNFGFREWNLLSIYGNCSHDVLEDIQQYSRKTRKTVTNGCAGSREIEHRQSENAMLPRDRCRVATGRHLRLSHHKSASILRTPLAQSFATVAHRLFPREFFKGSYHSHRDALAPAK